MFNHIKQFLAFLVLIIIVVLVAGIVQVLSLEKAHSSFDDYYNFRGCTTLVERGPDYGICTTATGDTIKITKFNTKWYLDGDLPTCWKNVCF